MLHSSDPDWDDHEGYSRLFYHRFFLESLPSLHRLHFRAFDVEQERYVIPAPKSLFTGHFPCPKELKYLGMFDGPMATAKGLTSCEIGFWSKAAGPTIISEQELRVLLDNNRTLESLAIHTCNFFGDDADRLTVVPMANLRCLNADCLNSGTLRIILHSIHTLQFKYLDTVHVSSHNESFHMVVRATDDSDRVFEHSRSALDDSHYHPLRSLGAHITTLRLRIRETFQDPHCTTMPSGFLRTLDTVQVLESDGMVADCVQSALSQSGMLPGLKVIRVAIDGTHYENALRFFASVSRSRMEEGNPLTTIEPCTGEGGKVLDQGLRTEWEKHFSKEGYRIS